MQHAYYITRSDLTHNLVYRVWIVFTSGPCYTVGKDAIVTVLVMTSN